MQKIKQIHEIILYLFLMLCDINQIGRNINQINCTRDYLPTILFVLIYCNNGKDIVVGGWYYTIRPIFLFELPAD